MSRHGRRSAWRLSVILPPGGETLAQLLTNDMTLPHQGSLDGVPPHYDWAAGPRVGYGNSAGPNDTWTAANCWGEVYTSPGHASVNTLVHVANLHCAHLSIASGQWTIRQNCVFTGPTGIDAGFFAADFQGNQTSEIQPITLADGTRAGAPNGSWNLHFFPQGRTDVVGSDIGAMCAWFDARLIMYDSGGVDDRASAVFLAGAGGDYYLNQQANWPNNGDYAIGRHRKVTNAWQTFTAHTMTAGQIATNPPPVIMAGTGGGGGGGGGGSSTWTRPNRQLRIMPLGDSITWTQAYMPSGWATRPAVFTGYGYNILTVGSQNNNGINHEGHGAWCADNVGNRCFHTGSQFQAGGILQSITGWMGTYTPDVIVLNIGTNDRYVASPYSDTQISAAVGQILDAIKTADPQCLTMLTKLKYWNEAVNGGTDNQALNNLFTTLVSTKQAAGNKVVLFDAYALVNNTNDYQGQWEVHPSDQGVGKMMTSTTTAMKSIFDAATIRP